MVLIEAITITSIVVGGALLGYIVKVIATSKCTDCNILGCVKVHRQVELEPKEASSFEMPKIM